MSNFLVFLQLMQGRNEAGARGAKFPRRRITMGAPNHCGDAEKSKMSQVLSSILQICLWKISGSNMGRQTCFLPRAI